MCADVLSWFAGDIRQYGILKDILFAQWRVGRYGHLVIQAPLQHVHAVHSQDGI